MCSVRLFSICTRHLSLRPTHTSTTTTKRDDIDTCFVRKSIHNTILVCFTSLRWRSDSWWIFPIIMSELSLIALQSRLCKLRLFWHDDLDSDDESITFSSSSCLILRSQPTLEGSCKRSFSHHSSNAYLHFSKHHYSTGGQNSLLSLRQGQSQRRSHLTALDHLINHFRRLFTSLREKTCKCISFLLSYPQFSLRRGPWHLHLRWSSLLSLFFLIEHHLLMNVCLELNRLPLSHPLMLSIKILRTIVSLHRI